MSRGRKRHWGGGYCLQAVACMRDTWSILEPGTEELRPGERLGATWGWSHCPIPVWDEGCGVSLGQGSGVLSFELKTEGKFGFFL